MESVQRNSAVDIAKGVAIICMVIGHSGCPRLIHNFMYSFQVPLFFLASGYCLKEIYINDIGDFTLRKFRTLYLPYIKWGVIFVLAHNFLCSIHCYDPVFGFKDMGTLPYSWKEVFEQLLNTIFFMRNIEPLLGGYWFVRELLIGSLVTVCLLRIIKKTYWILFVLFSLTFILLITKYQTPYLHFGFLSAYAALYIIVGYIGKTLYRSMSLKCDVLLLVLLIGLFYFFPHPGVVETTKKTFVLYFPLSIISSYVMFDICQRIQSSKSRFVAMIKFIGCGNTLIILTLHFLSFKLVSWLIVKIYGLGVTHIAEFPIISSYSENGWWIVYSIVGVALPLMYGVIRKFVKDMICKR